jgi:small-conductance mechanosensitive channel
MNMQWRRPQPEKEPRLTQPTWELLRTLEARVRANFRRPLLFGALALAALIAGHELGGLQAGSTRTRLMVYGCAAAVAVFGVSAARSTGNRVARLIAARGGASPAESLRIAVLLTGYVITLAAVLDLLALPVHYFVGGTVIAVVIGVAAQQVLGNLFAGLVLLFARPYKPGEYIRIRSGALGGPHEGTVTVLGLLYTTIHSREGDINIPNSALLAAAVGPVPDPTQAEPRAEDTGDAWTGINAADVQPADVPHPAAELELLQSR